VQTPGCANSGSLPSDAAAEAAAKQLVGTWVLRTYHRWLGSTAEPSYGEKPQGMLSYDDKGRMSVHIMRPGRPMFATGDRWQGTAEELKAAFDGYFAYYGRYEVDPREGVVVHHVEGSLLPNWVGTQQRRLYSLSGTQLTLTTPTSRVGDQEAKTVLLWQKRE
jgi:hypothetical protein